MNFDPSYIIVVLGKIVKYIPISLLMAVVAMVIAVAVGLVLAFMRNSSSLILRSLADV
jgi:putative amino-acid transport system permease protein